MLDNLMISYYLGLHHLGQSQGVHICLINEEIHQEIMTRSVVKCLRHQGVVLSGNSTQNRQWV